jgi:hypothetical protein
MRPSPMPDVDYDREQRILDLAIKLHAGDATAEEQQRAADSLSFTAGERLGLEQKAEALERDLGFILRVLRVFSWADATADLYWRCDDQYAPVCFFADCSDTFDWGSADNEEITPQNIELLEQSVNDVAALVSVSRWGYLGIALFCARVRGMRPMQTYVDAIPDECKRLFDACGPERESRS